MFKNKEKAKENFEWAKWLGAGLTVIGTAVVTICSGAISMLDKGIENDAKNKK